MRTKKLIAIAVLAVLGMSAQAQIVSSRSDQVIVTQQVKEKKTKKLRTFNWNIRLGYSMDYLTGGEELSMASGFDASFGISKSVGSNGVFWGVEVGAMSYGAKLKSTIFSLGANITPRIGMSFPLSQEIALNIYGGPYVGYRFRNSWDDADFSERVYADVDKGVDVGVNLGVEFFVSKNFFFDLHVKKGIIKAGKCAVHHNNYDVNGYYWDDSHISPLKLVLGIGFQF